MNRRGLARTVVRVVFAALALVCVAAIGVLVSQTIRDLRVLDTAHTDNVQWSVSQIETEFLKLSIAIDQQVHDPDADIASVRRDFDIFYSRVSTLGSAALYRNLREIPAFNDILSRINAVLARQIPLIDGPDAELKAGLDALQAALQPLRQDIRTLATLGLARSVSSAQERRNKVRETLSRLAISTLLLVIALAGMLFLARRAGLALSAANARLKTILETSLEAVIVADLDGRILEFSPAAEEIFRCSKASVLGQKVGDVLVPRAKRGAHQRGMRRYRDTGERHMLGQGRVRLDAQRADGSLFPIEMALQSARTDGGEIIIGFIRDISRRVDAEQELVEARDRALAGERAKAEFLAMMTHEIRTPLNGVLGNLSLLRETSLDDTQRRYVRNMGLSGEQLLSHVDAVLDIARFEAGADTETSEVVQPAALVQDIVDAQGSAAKMRGNSLDWVWVGAPLDWVRLDKTRLQQVILNLVGNAIKFTRDGQIRIELEQHARGDQTILTVRVTDNGIGIPEEDQARVFDDFQMLGGNAGQTAGGTGLGLGIARRIVTAMQGEIGLESMPGLGSVFWFAIPVDVTGPPESDETPSAIVPPLISARILLVEDHEISLQVAHDMLRHMGQQVETARDGQQAVALAGTQEFDLILMDTRMPVMDGLEATRAIRSGNGPNRDTPIISLSANVLPAAQSSHLAAGMSGFLSKPLRREDLEQTLRQITPRRDAPAGPGATAVDANTLNTLRSRYRQELTQFFQWLDAGNQPVSDIAERCHTCAGGAALFGDSALHRILSEAERHARNGACDETHEVLAKARTLWQGAPPRRGL